MREEEERREGDLLTPRLRSQRLASCPTPGRLSPASMERVREICVLPSTPTCVTVQTFNRAFQTDVGPKISQQRQNSIAKKGAACQKSPTEKEELIQVRRKTIGSSRLRRSLPDVRFKENISSLLLNKNQSAPETCEADRILKDSNVEEKKNVEQKTR